MRLKNLKSKIFLDGGDASETKEILNLLGFLDGQTTNPTLVSKNPEAEEKIGKGKRFTEFEVYDFYKGIVTEISSVIPKGSISVEVYADLNTKVNEMIKQARIMNSWIPNAHIKFPTTKEGIKAAGEALGMGIKVNMTLCFSQNQAAAVHCATKGVSRGKVYVSPFVGRLDDAGEDGMSLVENIIKMYKKGDSHVEVLTASVRNLDHFLYAIYLGSDIITAPFKILKEWADKNFPLPDKKNKHNQGNLKKIKYKNINLSKDWRKLNIFHNLTTSGIERFSTDWNFLIKGEFRQRLSLDIK